MDHFYHQRKFKLISEGIWTVLTFLLAIILLGVVFATNAEMITEGRGSWVTDLLGLTLIGVPMALLMAGGKLDLSVGGVLTLAGVIMAMMVREGMPAFMALLAVLVIGIIYGVIIGLLVGLARLPGTLLTFITAFMLNWIAISLGGGNFINVQPTDFMESLGRGPILAWLLMFLILGGGFVLVTFTRLGQQPQEHEADDRGLLPRLLQTGGPYVLSAFGASLYGCILVGRLMVAAPTIGAEMTGLVLLAVVLAGNLPGRGTANVFPVLFGALAVGMLRGLAVLAQIDGNIESGLVLWGVGGVLALIAMGLALITHLVLDRMAQGKGSPAPAANPAPAEAASPSG